MIIIFTQENLIYAVKNENVVIMCYIIVSEQIRRWVIINERNNKRYS
jgi:hypothetical protein